MSQNDKLNTKRKPQQNIEDGFGGTGGGGEVSSQNSGPKPQKKQKKITSLQGRPAKASNELRKLEDDIKKVAWRMAELEECLYLVYGGARATLDQQHQKEGIKAFSEAFNQKLAIDDFQSMLEEWKNFRSKLIDPLGEEYVPLSDRYFINKLFPKGEQEEYTVEFISLMTIYAFQIFLRTDLDGFKSILKMMKLVYKHGDSETKGVVSLNNDLKPERMGGLVEKELEEQEKDKFNVIYGLLNQVMVDSFIHFTKTKVIKIVKNNMVEKI